MFGILAALIYGTYAHFSLNESIRQISIAIAHYLLIWYSSCAIGTFLYGIFIVVCAFFGWEITKAQIKLSYAFLNLGIYYLGYSVFFNVVKYLMLILGSFMLGYAYGSETLKMPIFVISVILILLGSMFKGTVKVEEV